MNEGQQGWAKEQWRANKRADLCTMTWQQETRDRLRDKSWMVYCLFYWLVMVCWRDQTGITLPVTTSLSKKAKRKHVALSKVKIDCRCRKLSPFFCQFLSAVGESEKDCRHIFEQCRLSPKPLGRPRGYEDCTIDVNKTILLYFLLRQVFYCPQNDRWKILFWKTGLPHQLTSYVLPVYLLTPGS